MLKGYGIEIEWLRRRLPEIQADELEFIVKEAAKQVLKTLRKPFIIEDSGLFIEALNGFPGPYSAYVERKIGNEGILKLMKGVGQRKAEFRCVVAFSEGRKVKLFKDAVRGRITHSIRGRFGFGFDPIFCPQGEERTLAQMKMEEKNRFSHRARAFRKFALWYRKWK